MKVLILGGTGAMGVPLSKILIENGHKVYVSTRKNRTDSTGINYLCGDAHDLTFISTVLNKEKYDAIVDFMIYSEEELRNRIDLFLDNTNQYFFISSARVYAPCEGRIKETSPRLLDVCEDRTYIESNEYAIAKAREENIFLNSTKKNWTIIRPTLTYNSEKLQYPLGEKEDWLFRALHGKTVVVPSDMKNVKVSFTFGEDVAKGIAMLIGKQTALGEIFHIANEDSIAWSEILSIYQNYLMDKLGIKMKIKEIDSWDNISRRLKNYYQIKYARSINREFDSSKIESVAGKTIFVSPEEGIKKCLDKFFEHTKFEVTNWNRQAVFDSITKEFTSLKYFNSFKRKIGYVLTRLGVLRKKN